MKKIIILTTFLFCLFSTILYAQGHGPPSGGGAVDSVFGRTDAVTAAAGDYETSEVTESTDKNYVTDAESVVVGHTSGTNTGDNSANSSTYSPGGIDVALADGGTGESLADPGADRILFWDDSEGTLTWLIPGTGLAISATTLNVSITSLHIALLENYILSGNGSNLAAGVAVSGDVTNADGVFTIGNDKIDPAMISTDAVTPDAIDKDGAFTGLTGNWKTTGSLSGQAEFTTDAAGAITITVNAVNYGTDTGDADIPDGACDAAADVGNWVVLISSLKNQYSLTSDDASNIFILADNSTLTAGDELDVDGSMVSVMCMEADRWKVVGYIDVAPTDGGPAD